MTNAPFDPPTPPTMPTTTAPTAPVKWWKNRKFGLPTWVWLTGAIVIVLGAIGAAAGGGKDADTTDPGVETTRLADTTVVETSQAETTVVETTQAVETTEKATTTTPKPTTTTAAPTTTVPATIIFSGSGSDVIDLGGGTDRLVLHATHDGSSNFIVTSLDADLSEIGYPVNEIGRFDGRLMIDSFGDVADIRFFQVDADGAWTIELLDINQLQVVGSTAFNGQGADVVIYPGAAGVFTVTHDGESNFIVNVSTSDDTNFVINEIGNYSGRVPIAAGPALVEIVADGNWSFTKG